MQRSRPLSPTSAANGTSPRSAKRGKQGANRKATAAVNDSLHSRQWSHGAVRIHEARQLPGFVEAEDVVVAVVDSGIDSTHPDLDGVIESYVNHLAHSEGDEDFEGHGTHVAGIVAAERQNAIGIAGLCRARIQALKGLPRFGNVWDATAYYQALAHPIDHEARVLNLSLGGGFDPGERDVIEDVLAASITVVAAMGNEYLEGNATSYPAAYDGVIAVGATDELDRRAVFSNTGNHIDLVAPGVRVLSTVPTYPSRLADGTDYEAWPGTSMATPQVAAAVALLLARTPDLTPSDARRILTDSADHVPGQTGWNRQYGAGRLNIEAALPQ